jgi:hypothetical protein
MTMTDRQWRKFTRDCATLTRELDRFKHMLRQVILAGDDLSRVVSANLNSIYPQEWDKATEVAREELDL